MLPEIISDVQGAFVEGRQILNSVLIAHECVDSRHKQQHPGLICKLDFAKPYDMVDWGFLQYMMERMGFGKRWWQWIKCCVSSAHFSILLNGSSKGYFKSSRGLRQGNPLSPMPFVIVAEALNTLLERAKQMQLILGFAIEGSFLEVTHLQFADDTIIFCDASLNQVETLKFISKWFEWLSA